MNSALEEESAYKGIDKSKWIWVEADPNEPRDIRAKYMETHSGVGFDPTKNMSTRVFKLVDRLEYEVTNNPERLSQLRQENPKQWTKIVMKNMDLLTSAEEVEYFFDEAYRQGIQWFKTSEYKKLNSSIRNDKNLIKTLFEKGLNFVGFADKETQKQLVLEDEKFLKYVPRNYVEEFTEAIKLQNVQQDFQEEKIEANEEIVQENVKLNEDWNDYNFVMKKVQEDGYNICKASKELKKDKSIVIEAVKSCPDVIYWDKDLTEYLGDKEVMIEAVKHDGSVLRFGSDGIKNDKDIVVEAVKQSKSAIRFASEEIKDNAEIMTDLIQGDNLGIAIEEVSDRLKDDKRFMEKAINENYYAFENASAKLRDDEGMVKLATEKYGYQKLEYASSRLRSDYNFMQEQIWKEPHAFQYASPVLKNDEVLAAKAVSHDCRMFLQVSDRLKESKNFQATAFNSAASHDYMMENLVNWTTKDLLMQVLDNPLVNLGNVVPYLRDEKKNDLDIITKAVKRDGRMLEFASQDLRDDEKLIDIATKQDYKNIRFIGDDTKKRIDTIRTTKKVVYSSEESKQKWQNYKQMQDMNNIIERYKTDETMKLKDIKGDYFTNPTFYNDVVNVMRDKVMSQFHQMTQGLQTDEVIDARLQQKLQQKLQDVQAKLERRKNFAIMKSTIKQYFKASSVSGKISSIEV